LENIVDQIKDATNEAFEHAEKQQEEIHLDMQENIVALRQILETMQLETIPRGQQVKVENTTWTTEVKQITSIVSREICVMKIEKGALEFPHDIMERESQGTKSY
jgi:hypothetical protein